MATVKIAVVNGPTIEADEHRITIFKDGIVFGASFDPKFLPNEEIVQIDCKGRIYFDYKTKWNHDGTEA